MSAMPTGSLAPDSPCSSVPDRPDTSRRPSTENTTAGSVGASAVPMSSERQPAQSEQDMCRERQGRCRDQRADDAEPDHRSGGRPKATPADVHATLEQDQREAT